MAGNQPRSDISADWQAAVAAQQRGALPEAIALYRKIIAAKPEHADAYANLASCLRATGDLTAALTLLGAAVTLQPARADILFNLGNAQRVAGDLQGAVETFRKAVGSQPRLGPAWLNLGLVLRALDRDTEALQALDRASELMPEMAQAHGERGSLLRKLAQACARKGERGEAIALLQRALDHDPESSLLLAEWAMALRADGRGEAARERLAAAVARAPDDVVLRRCLGILHVDAERMDDAIAQLEVALRHAPDDAQAHLAMANALLAIGRLSAAQDHAERVLALDPKAAGAHSFMGFAMAQRGELAQAMASFGRAADCDARPDSHLSNLLFVANYREDLSSGQIAALHRRFGQAVREAHLPPASPDRDPERRLRIGYLSPDFREHSVAAFFEPLLAAHSPAAVETVCYAVVPKPDAVTGRLKRHAALWRDIDGLGAREAAELIRRDRIDILVDLAGHTARNRLRVFACKPAPIQATYIGYPNTTGLAEVDVRLTDAVADPLGENDAHYSETLLRLPRCFLAYGAPPDAPAVQEPPAAVAGHVTFGSFNALPKLTPGTARAWARILAAVPGARLLLKAPSFADPGTRARIAGLFTAEGVAPSRLELLTYTQGRMEHLALYGRIDIGLDPFPYNGTTTTCEALWMGVPVLTLRGARHAGRVGASLLTAVGLDELVAESLDDYVAKAAALAADLPRLGALRGGLRARLSASPLCDAAGLARDLEAAYRDLWRRYLTQSDGVSSAGPTEREPDYETILGLMATDFAAAEAQLEAASRRGPSSVRAQIALGYVRSFRKDHAGAVVALQRAVEIDPRSVNGHFNLGYCLERLGRLDAALARYETAAELSQGKTPDAEIQAAACLHRLGRCDEAVARYRRVLERHADSLGARYGLLRAQREQDETGAAEETATRLRRLLAEQPARAGALVSWLNRYDFPGWSALDDKAALLERAAALRAARGAAAFDYLPESFVLPDQRENLIAAHRPGDVWILKPAALFGGQGVRLLDAPDDLPEEPGWLAQRYIGAPLLLDGRKFHLRLYLLVAGVAPPCLALWQEGIARLAVEPYRLDRDALGEIERHVTNSVRFRDHPGMHLSSNPDREDEGNVWSLSAALRHVAATADERGRLRASLLELAQGVARVIGHAGLLDAQRRAALRFAYPPKLLGLDVLFDRSGRPWLLEIEAFPALAGGGAAVVGKLHERLFGSVAQLALAPPGEALKEQAAWNDWHMIAADERAAKDR